jgi:hypothetical protein
MSARAARGRRDRRDSYRFRHHQVRRDLCAEYGVANTGRQFRKLRKRLALEEKTARRGQEVRS